MSKIRTIRGVVKGQNVTDGAGIRPLRVFGNHNCEGFDPFLMLDVYDSVNPKDYIKGLPWHPHRGVETITYLIKGKLEYEDSLENRSIISDGDCQWVTLGSGMFHQEMPKPVDRMLGFQLWLNLPAKNKMVTPKYREILKENIPVLDEGDVKIHIVAGKYKGTQSAFEGDYVKVQFLDVEIKANCEWSLDTQKDSTLFVYIIQGEGCFDPALGDFIPEKNAVLFGEGKTLRVKASNNGIRFLLLSGKPLNEPVVWGGPIVMNTFEEVEQGFEDMDRDFAILD